MKTTFYNNQSLLIETILGDCINMTDFNIAIELNTDQGNYKKGGVLQIPFKNIIKVEE